MAAGSQEPRGCYSCCAFIQSQECSATAAGAPSYPVLRWPDENKEKGLKVHFKGYTTKAGEEKMCTYRVEIGGIVQYINVDTILKWANLWSEHGGNIPKFTVTQDLDESDIRVQLAGKFTLLNVNVSVIDCTCIRITYNILGRDIQYIYMAGLNVIVHTLLLTIIYGNGGAFCPTQWSQDYEIDCRT